MNENSSTMLSLKAAIQARMPCVLVGPPGVGKTASIRGIAESMNAELITLIGSQMDPTDITGLPKGEIVGHNEEGEPIWGTVYLAPWWQVRIMQKKRVFLFLDEWSNTPAAVRASMLTMLQEREFPNGQKMPDETIVVGAMNPTDQAADGWDLDKPTTNRILFLVWKTLNDDWYKGMLSAWGREISKEEKFWRHRIVKFLQENPSYIHRENEEGGTPEAFNIDANDPSAQEVLRYAWASRRAWDNLARVLSFVDQKNVAVQDEIALGVVGAASALQFRQWIMQNSSYDPRDVLKDPASVDWATISVSDATLIFEALPSIITKANWSLAIDLLDTIAEAEVTALVAAHLQKILEKIMAGAREMGEQDTAQQRMLSVLRRYQTKAPA